MLIGERSDDSDVAEDLGSQRGSECHVVGVIFLDLFHGFHQSQNSEGNEGSQHYDKEGQFPTEDPEKEQTSKELQEISEQNGHVVRTDRVNSSDIVA